MRAACEPRLEGFLFGILYFFLLHNALGHVASLAPIAGNLPGCNKSMYVNDSRPL